MTDLDSLADGIEGAIREQVRVLVEGPEGADVRVTYTGVVAASAVIVAMVREERQRANERIRQLEAEIARMHVRDTQRGDRRLDVARARDGRIVLESLGGGMPVGIRMTDAEARVVADAVQALLGHPVQDGET